MSDETDPELSAWLARARAGLAPTAEDAARVRAGVSGALDGAATSTQVPGAAPRTGPRATTLRALGRFGVVAAIAAAAGAGGYALGYRAGVADRDRARQSEPTAVIQIPVERAGDAAWKAPSPAPTQPSEPTPEPRPSEHAVHSATPGSSAAAPPSGPLQPPPPVNGESSLELEARLLGRIERALRDANPRLALGLLGELDREVPGGQLGEEREAARVMAHCALGTTYAAKLAHDFASNHANSAYAARIADACAGSERVDAGE